MTSESAVRALYDSEIRVIADAGRRHGTTASIRDDSNRSGAGAEDESVAILRPSPDFFIHFAGGENQLIIVSRLRFGLVDGRVRLLIDCVDGTSS